MNPYLTGSGRYVLFSAIVFLLVGIAVSNPTIVLLGQVQIVLLAVGFLLIAPSALVLDRRLVTMRVEPEEAARIGTGHVLGDTVDVALEVTNTTDHALHNFRALPFAADALQIGEEDVATVIAGGDVATASFGCKAERGGRWMLHGFDVSVTDPLALVETRDYLPCNHAFEFYPAAGKLRSRLARRPPMGVIGGGLHVVSHVGSGTEIRQLRDWRPGDSLRDIAWKASLRTRKLISREFEREVTANVYVAVDVSSSMRGGRKAGEKLEWAVHYTVDLVDMLLDKRDRVGLLTFDEKMYGHIAPGNSAHQMRRILHHLVGLDSIVDEDLTELDDAEVERLAADYLLVQERLDFRRGTDLAPSGVNRNLMNQWVRSISASTKQRFETPVLREGVVERETTPIREFLRYRGVPIPYRVEARLGMKERGLVQTLEQVVRTAREPHWIVVISDLCGIMNIESLVRGVNLVRADGHQIEFVVPFTPWFYKSTPDDPKYEIVRELFTSAEAEERSRIVTRLRSLGVNVQVPRI